MGSSIAVMFLLPALDKQSPLKSPIFRTEFRFFFWVFVGTVVFLMILGTLPADEPFTALSQKLTFYYFFYFLGILPALGWFESVISSEVAFTKVGKLLPFFFLVILSLVSIGITVNAYCTASPLAFDSSIMRSPLIGPHELYAEKLNAIASVNKHWVDVDVLRQTVSRLSMNLEGGVLIFYELHIPTGVERFVEHFELFKELDSWNRGPHE